MLVIHIVLGLSLGVSMVDSSSLVGERPVTQVAFGWQRFGPKDEEFSALTPARPSILIKSGGYTLSKGGERVLEQQVYSAYADGFIFVVESYKASRPQKLLRDMNHIFSRLEPLEDVQKDGFDGKKYQMARKDFFGYVYYFVTAKHIYIVTVAAREANHPSITRFVSSFSLANNTGSTGDVLPRREDGSVSSGGAPANVTTSKEATQKVIVVWKPEPAYTESARSNQRIGTVVLKGIFTSSGQVIISDVIKGLKDGLTENAIEAARHIRFFPAEKDGKPVSVILQLEYNFNLY